jgi:hypothetical protein
VLQSDNAATLELRVPGTTTVRQHTALASLDLESGAPKIRWNLPGDNDTCNDFAIGADHTLYISDTGNSKIGCLQALPPPNYMYVNNVFRTICTASRSDAAGKAGWHARIQR